MSGTDHKDLHESNRFQEVEGYTASPRASTAYSQSRPSIKSDPKLVKSDEEPVKCLCPPVLRTYKPRDSSMLVTGFGIRNVDSLQRALLDDEQRRLLLLAKYDKDEDVECLSFSSLGSFKSKISSVSSAVTRFTETDHPSDMRLPLEYLMGLDTVGEEEGSVPGKEEGRRGREGMEEEESDEGGIRTTVAMRRARKYLRTHKIFEFFQFLNAHLLSAMPENPIEFLLDLLDKCLLYRSGYGNPPLLFERPHLEQLFYLMDRLRTGYIELEQYKTGMHTLGICNYDKNPPMSADGMVSKENFIEEAYECLTDLFVDLVRRRGGTNTTPSLVTPPPTMASLTTLGQ